jgi:thiamine monophosphate kinase
VSRQNLKRAENVAKKKKLKLIVIGKATSGTGKVFITSKHKLKKELWLLDNRGYLHFQNKSKV